MDFDGKKNGRLCLWLLCWIFCPAQFPIFIVCQAYIFLFNLFGLWLPIIARPEDSHSLAIRNELRLSVNNLPQTATAASPATAATKTAVATVAATVTTELTEEEGGAKGQGILTLSLEMQYGLVAMLLGVAVLYNKRRIERVIGPPLGRKGKSASVWVSSEGGARAPRSRSSKVTIIVV